MSTKNNKPDSQTRRRTLHTLGVTGGAVVATKWSKPIVDSVIIPAHAETSAGTTEAPVSVVAGGGGGGDSGATTPTT